MLLSVRNQVIRLWMRLLAAKVSAKGFENVQREFAKGLDWEPSNRRRLFVFRNSFRASKSCWLASQNIHSFVNY
jgi:hypothetical protein